MQDFYCADGTPASNPLCAGTLESGACGARCDDPSLAPYDTSSACTARGGPEVCNGVDDNYDGCIDEKCIRGSGACKCEASCDKPSCNPSQVADCSAKSQNAEICGDGLDNNCNGSIDEHCSDDCKAQFAGTVTTPSAGCCKAKAGADPILIASGAAITEPFSDFSVEALSKLSFSRTYNSIDYSLLGGPAGIFGRGWRHDWEATLTCENDMCTVARGIVSGFQFKHSGDVLSLDGAETWTLYLPYTTTNEKGDQHNVLVRRPGGAWILFLTDGRELEFRTVCDACSSSEMDLRLCAQPEMGGIARLTKVADRSGRTVSVQYDRPAGLFIGLEDQVGHVLELRNSTACSTGLATELRYDGSVVATYVYQGSDLSRSVDADGSVLRDYAYDPDGRLLAVRNEAGDAVAEFSYDALGRAIGVVDSASSVGVNYDDPAGVAVTEYFRGPDGDTFATSIRSLDVDGRVTSVSDGCACGPAQTFVWSQGLLACSTDAQSHVDVNEYDAVGRTTRTVAYKGTTCTPPSTLPADSTQERRGYGIAKPIAQAVALDLDIPTSVTRKSGINLLTSAQPYTRSLDYDQLPKSDDPPGYACTEVALPAGGVVCREVVSGYIYIGSQGGVLFERHATYYSYDPHGRVVRTYGPVNLDRPSATDVTPIEERTYWGDQESLARRGRLKEIKRYAAATTPPLVTSYDYDSFGVYRIAASDGGMTTIIRDARGRPRFVLSPDGQQRETRYYDGLSPRLQVNPSGSAVSLSYDGKGRVTASEWFDGDPEAAGAEVHRGRSEHHAYDAAGNRIHSERRDTQGAVTWERDAIFDVQHRVVRETNPEYPSLARVWTYDSSGFLSSTSDEEGRETLFTPDGVNRVTSVRKTGLDPSGLLTSLDVAVYTYAQNSGTLSSVKDGAGVTTKYKVDDFGRVAYVTKLNEPLGPEQFIFDARGNMLERRNGNQIGKKFTYDGLDRVLTSYAWKGSESVTYSYQYDAPGAEGRLASVTEPDRSIGFTYDGGGRIASEMILEKGVSAPLVTSYSYDANGATSEITYPSGLRIRYDRDPSTGDVVRVLNLGDGTVYANNIAHYPNGPSSDAELGNATVVRQTLDRRYQPAAISSGPVALAYSMSPAGDVNGIVDTSTTMSGLPRSDSAAFAYDFLDRLSSSAGWLSYSYDGAGNRTAESVEGTAASFTYATMSRVKERVVAGVRRHAFAYDNANTLAAIAEYDPSGSTIVRAICLYHDAAGRLVLYGNKSLYLTPGGGACSGAGEVTKTLARFKYDFRDRRIARQDATGTWVYVVSDSNGNPLSELKFNGDPQNPWQKVRDYVWLDGKPLVQIEYPGPAGSSEGYAYYFHVDHIGLPRALTNSAGQIVWEAKARPYGDVAETTALDPLSGRTVVPNLRLPGQYDERLLGSVGLQGPYYNWNRWYLPGVGRYLELDPVALAGGFNGGFGPEWYGYANQNPMRWTDSTGLYAEVCCRAVKGPLGTFGAKHCYLRTGGPSGDTTSYWAEWVNDDTPHVTGDLQPDWPAECHPIDPPNDPPTCGDKTPFDRCLEQTMKDCEQRRYSMWTFNCCDCVDYAVKMCGGSYSGPWPNNLGFSPGYQRLPGYEHLGSCQCGP